MRSVSIIALMVATVLAAACAAVERIDRGGAAANAIAGRRFLDFRNLQDWTAERSAATNEAVYVSPTLDAGLAWNELVASWNLPASPSRYVRIDAQAVYPDHATKWFNLGCWCDDAALHPRESMKDQKDADGDVQTDTMVLSHPADRLRLRVTAGGADPNETAPPEFLGVSLLDTSAVAPESGPIRRAWGRSLNVPERSQLAYPAGKVWCCPTSTSMVLGYWSKKLKRADLDRDVPAVAAGVFDRNWPGCGNWPFNTALAGSLPGMRAYVTRLAGMNELEQWVGAGVPVVCSVSYRLLHGKANAEMGGHVVVCCGFTAAGDVIVNEPWAELDRGDTVRITVRRSHMAAAWAKSHNTAFLIYPASLRPPRDRAGHWDGGPGRE